MQLLISGGDGVRNSSRGQPESNVVKELVMKTL